MRNSKAIKAMRAFNRFYTNIIGVVDRHILHSPYSLTEVRILYEIFHDPICTARKIKKILQVDEGYLSRTIDKLIKRGLITRKQSPSDGRVFVLSLSKKGEATFLKLNEQSEASVAAILEHLTPEEKNEIMSLMRRLQELLRKKEENHGDQT